jgi:hypothetical protein
MSTQPAQFYMPFRGEWCAPSFNKAKPRELVRFFKELERLFVRAAVTSEEEKKEQVLRYIDFEIEEFWETLPEYKNPLATYDEFKAAILSLYPDASGDYIYSLSDVDFLIRERQELGINNATDLADFHLRFHMITSWLVDKKHLSDLEQRRAYIGAFPMRLLSRIDDRLQMKFPDLHPNIPYHIRDVYDAAQYILHKPTSRARTYFSPVPAPPATSDSPIKSENLQTIFGDLSRTLTDILCQNSQEMEHSSVKRNMRNPISSSAPELRHATDNLSLYATKSSLDDRISQIEAELYALRASESSFVPTAFNKAERAKSAHIDNSDDEYEVPKTFPEKEIAPNRKAQPQTQENGILYDPDVPTSILAPQLTIPNRVDPASDHLFREAQHIAYTHSPARNIRESCPRVRTKLETVYMPQPVVYKAPIAMDAYDQLQDTENAIAQRPALLVSSDVCAQTQDFTATCKELSREAHLLRNPLQIYNTDVYDLSASPDIEAQLLPTSIPTSDSSATPATPFSISNKQLCLNDSLSVPSSSATSFEFYGKIPLRNTLETSISDPPTTLVSTCDHSDSISDPAIATFSATSNISSEYSDFYSVNNKQNSPSNHCDLSISKLNSANTIATPTTSIYCDICDSDLNFATNLAISEIFIGNNHTEMLRILSNSSDPFRYTPTLDHELTPYVPTSRYQQDRTAVFKVFTLSSLRFLHICDFFICLCVYIGFFRIFQGNRNIGSSILLSAYSCSQIGRIRSEYVSSGCAFRQISDLCAILRFCTCPRISSDFISEIQHKLYLRSHLSISARTSLYLVAFLIPTFSIAYSISPTLIFVILGFLFVSALLAFVIAQKSQFAIASVGLVIRTLQKCPHLTFSIQNSFSRRLIFRCAKYPKCDAKGDV